MDNWRGQLKYDPVPVLLASEDEALIYFARRDLLDEQVAPVDTLWDLPEAAKILKKQREDGSWKYPGKRAHGQPGEDYAQLETYRQLRVLVDQYGFQREHPAVQAIAAFYYERQTGEGDIRGLFGPEYAPHYMAWIMELLIKAGYEEEAAIERGFQWFLDKRQEDGGWAWPIRTANVSYYDAIEDPEPTQPVRSKPFSHVLTGGILRAFAVHPRYHCCQEALHAADLVKSRFFRADPYPDRKAVAYWFKLQYPFWWPNVLTALDSLSLMGYTAEDADVHKGLDWFVGNQEEGGLWKLGYKESKSARAQGVKQWTALAVCRVLRRLMG